MINQQELENLTKQIVARLERECSLQSLRGRILVPVGVTARHIHLTREVLDALFGKGYELQRLRDLSQPGEFAARETVTIVGPSGRPIENVRLLGPLRSYTQVELARSDGIRLGLDLPIRRTGDLSGTPGLTLIGPRGTVILKQGAIRPTRHIHMTEFDAEKFGLSNGQVVRVKVGGEAGVIFENVIIRVSPGYSLDFHIDTDDANAAGLSTGSLVEVLP